jgi:hypothetical protein
MANGCEYSDKNSKLELAVTLMDFFFWIERVQLGFTLNKKSAGKLIG